MALSLGFVIEYRGLAEEPGTSVLVSGLTQLVEGSSH